MSMNDGNPFMDSYGSICYPPRGDDNPYSVELEDDLNDYYGEVDQELVARNDEDAEDAFLATEIGRLTYE